MRTLKPNDYPAAKRLARKVFKNTSDNQPRASPTFEAAGGAFIGLETPAGAN
jgi:hypothetical protein